MKGSAAERTLAAGCHLSSSKGFAAMGREALGIGATTFQFFTRNPRGTKAKAHNAEDAAALAALLREHNFAPVVAHAPYTLNLCSADPHLRQLAKAVLADDLDRLESLPGNYYNLHPGNHCGQGLETGVAFIAAALDEVLAVRRNTVVLLETMAGKGSEVGKSFRELRTIIDATDHKNSIGVCLDTCHVWDAGCDIVGNLEGVLEDFDREIGLARLKAIHINDSRNPCGARKDRHAKIGEGAIGLEAFGRICRHPALAPLPFCLETPNDLPGYAEEIALLRRLAAAPSP